MRLGAYQYNSELGANVIEGSKILFMENFFELFMCALLNGVALMNAHSDGVFGEFFETTPDVVCSTITILYTLMLPIFLIYAFRVTKPGISREGMFFDGINTKHRWQAKYHALFLLRRTVICLILVGMTHLPFFQCNLMLGMSLLNLCYLVASSPLQGICYQWQEVFNETTIYFSCLTISLFLNIDIAQIS